MSDAGEVVNFTPVGSTIPFFVSDKFVNLIVGPFGCLAAGSLVITEEGAIPIADIDRPMRVLSWNEMTGRYQLSLSGGSFPKGRDYLYRVVTPQGEFDAAGSHQLLCADGVYRRVESLRPGDVLASYSGIQRLTSLDADQLLSTVDVQSCEETVVSYEGDYAALARLYGQRFLQVEDSAPFPAPSLDGAQVSSRPCACRMTSRTGDPLEPLPQRIHYGLPYVQSGTDGCSPLVAHLHEVEAGHAASVFCECGAGSALVGLRFRLTTLRRQLKRGLCQLIRYLAYPWVSPSCGSTERAIVSVTRKQTQELYYDMQVRGTHNYVTVDGAIHHNSTKTTSGLMKIAYEAKRVAPCKDGVRRSRVSVIRNTAPMLRDTTIPDFLEWFPEGQAGIYHRSDKKFTLVYDDVECEVLFRALDDEGDVKNLLSLQLTFAVIDEFREMKEQIFASLRGRIGRYPNKKLNGVGCKDDEGNNVDKLWGMTNPPDADTFWERYLTSPPPNTAVFFQPSGLSPEADWLHLLKDGYYENIMQGQNQDWVDVYVHAKFGRSLSGKPVFQAFNRGTHVSKTGLKPVHSTTSPLIIGVDAGLSPAAVIGQVNYRGQLLIYASLISEGMGAVRFIREKLKPLLNSRFTGMHAQVVIDPAAFQRSQTDERTVAEMYRREGFSVKPARTNSISARLGAVDNYLTRIIDGDPLILFDCEHSESIIMAMAGKYRYKLNKNGEIADTPDKSHPWSDVADALEYLCLFADQGGVFNIKDSNTTRRDVHTISSAGWT